MVKFKSTCQKWHFGQVEHGDNWDIFYQFFQLENPHFFCSVKKLWMGKEIWNFLSFKMNYVQITISVG
jgi:hypothetical protein